MASNSAQIRLAEMGFDMTDISKSPQIAWEALDKRKLSDDLWAELFEIIWRYRCYQTRIEHPEWYKQ